MTENPTRALVRYIGSPLLPGRNADEPIEDEVLFNVAFRNNIEMLYFEALERAVELEPIPQTLTVLAEAYDSAKQPELAATLREKAARMLVPDETAPATAAPRKQRRPRQPRKIIM